MVEKERFNFEDALKRLQYIVERMEEEDISLEESINLYEQGTTLSKQCASYLDEIKLRIEKVNQSDT